MSNDDAWSLPDSSAVPAGSAESVGSAGSVAPVEPAADPAVPGIPGVGVATVTAASGAVLDAAPAAALGAGVGIAGGLGAIERPRTAQPDRVLWLIAAGLFLVAGAAEIAYLFGQSEVFFPGQHNYDVLAVVTARGLYAVILIADAVLLLLPRTRQVAAGLAMSVSLLSIAYDFGVFRPIVFKLEDHVAVWARVGGLVFVAVGGPVALVAVIRRPRASVAAVRRRQSRVDRVAAMTLGFFGAAIVVLGSCLDSFRAQLSVGTDQESFQCCGWSHSSGWAQAQLAVGGFALLLLAVLAATLSSKILAAGVLIGAALQSLPTLAQVVILIVAPVKSFYGFAAPQGEIASGISIGPAAGFWLDLFGMLLLVAAAVARLRLGQRRNPYSAQPFAEPGHSAPVR